MQPAAIQGDYTDLRFIKGRKVAVISIEIPIEAANAFVSSFGTPSPATGVPVALARLQTAKEAAPAEKAPRKLNELPLPQQAALLCDREAFVRFARERFGQTDAAEFMRAYCNVSSRSQIKPDTAAAELFHILKGEFDVWMRAA